MGSSVAAPAPRASIMPRWPSRTRCPGRTARRRPAGPAVAAPPATSTLPSGSSVAGDPAGLDHAPGDGPGAAVRVVQLGGGQRVAATVTTRHQHPAIGQQHGRAAVACLAHAPGGGPPGRRGWSSVEDGETEARGVALGPAEPDAPTLEVAAGDAPVHPLTASSKAVPASAPARRQRDLSSPRVSITGRPCREAGPAEFHCHGSRPSARGHPCRLPLGGGSRQISSRWSRDQL